MYKGVSNLQQLSTGGFGVRGKSRSQQCREASRYGQKRTLVNITIKSSPKSPPIPPLACPLTWPLSILASTAPVRDLPPQIHLPQYCPQSSDLTYTQASPPLISTTPSNLDPLQAGNSRPSPHPSEQATRVRTSPQQDSVQCQCRLPPQKPSDSTACDPSSIPQAGNLHPHPSSLGRPKSHVSPRFKGRGPAGSGGQGSGPYLALRVPQPSVCRS